MAEIEKLSDVIANGDPELAEPWDGDTSEQEDLEKKALSALYDDGGADLAEEEDDGE